MVEKKSSNKKGDVKKKGKYMKYDPEMRETIKEFSNLKSYYKKKHVNMGIIDHIAFRAILDMPKDVLEKQIVKYMGL